MRKLALALCLCASLFAFHGEGFGLKKALKEVELSAQQEEQVKALFDRARQEHKDDAALARQRETFAQLFSAESFDKQAFINTANERVGKIAQLVSELHAILTPQQREAFAQSIKAHALRHK
jgi:Spy/CpxP family protein refolding chaperone